MEGDVWRFETPLGGVDEKGGLERQDFLDNVGKTISTEHAPPRAAPYTEPPRKH